MKNVFVVFAAFVVSTVMAAEVLAPAAKKDFISEWGGNLIVSGDALSVKAACRVRSMKALPVSPDKKYKLSGEFRVVDGDAVTLYFGLIPQDAKKRFIGPRNAIATGSTAVLAAPAAKGSKTIVIKNMKRAGLFKANPQRYIAFDTDNSGKYADLPNFNIAGPITKVTANADKTLTVTLRSSVPAAFKAGSGIRIHMNGGTFLTVAGEKETLNVTPQWQTFEGVTIPGAVRTHTRKQLRVGTKSVRIVFFAPKDKKNSEKTRIEFRNIKLQEVK